MAYTHCPVVFLAHHPNADRPSQLFRIVGIDVQSLSDLRCTLNTMTPNVDFVDEFVKRRHKFRDHPVAIEPTTAFICTSKACFFTLAYPVSKERLLREKPPYRPAWKAELVANVAGDMAGFIDSPQKGPDVFSIVCEESSDPLVRIWSYALEDWIRASTLGGIRPLICFMSVI